MASVLAATARWEGRIIGQRTREGMAAARAKGRLPGRRSALPPHVQARLLADRTAGLSLRTIADRLTAEGIPTTTGRTVWRASTVHAAVRSANLEQQARSTVLGDPAADLIEQRTGWLRSHQQVRRACRPSGRPRRARHRDAARSRVPRRRRPGRPERPGQWGDAGRQDDDARLAMRVDGKLQPVPCAARLRRRPRLRRSPCGLGTGGRDRDRRRGGGGSRRGNP